MWKKKTVDERVSEVFAGVEPVEMADPNPDDGVNPFLESGLPVTVSFVTEAGVEAPAEPTPLDLWRADADAVMELVRTGDVVQKSELAALVGRARALLG
ncbi:MAG: hypothetical protein ACKVQA_06845 [Burkholderiales bacterium]